MCDVKVKQPHEYAMSGDQSVPLMQRRPKLSWAVSARLNFSKLKMRQRSKIAEIRATLVDAGFVALDEQAATLGLSRSTAWSILNPHHKSSGLSAYTICRILRSPRLPGFVRQRVPGIHAGKYRRPVRPHRETAARICRTSYGRVAERI